MKRRGFLAACLALSAAPAIVRASSLMKIASRSDEPFLFGGQDIVINQMRTIKPNNIRQEARRELADWWARRMDEITFVSVNGILVPSSKRLILLDDEQ